MALCISDTLGLVPGCEVRSTFEQVAQGSTGVLVIGAFDDPGVGAYHIERPLNAPTLTITGLALPYSDLDITGGGDVTLAFGSFEGVSVTGGSLNLVATLHHDAVEANDASAFAAGVGLRDDGRFDVDGGSLVVSTVRWTDVPVPVVLAKDATVWMTDVSIAGSAPGEAGLGLVHLDDADLSLIGAEFCGHTAPIVAGTCAPIGADPDRDECRVERTLVRTEHADRLVFDGDGPWAVVRTTMVLDAEPGAGPWGVANPAARGVELHASPQEGAGEGEGEVSFAAVLTDHPWFTPPPAFQCAPAIPDPRELGFRPERVWGAYTAYAVEADDPLFAAWWDDPDGDEVPAMWDCAPDAARPLRRETADTSYDDDCDGVRACLGEDDDGDGVRAVVEVTDRDAPCDEGPEDPDDDDPCVPAACDTETGGTPGDDTAAGAAISGFSGSGCDTGRGGGGLAVALALAALGRRRRAR